MYALFEITMYPLTRGYTVEIVDFIDRLRAAGLDPEITETSSLIRGEYDRVMDILRREIKAELAKGHRVSFVMKVLNTENS